MCLDIEDIRIRPGDIRGCKKETESEDTYGRRSRMRETRLIAPNKNEGSVKNIRVFLLCEGKASAVP